MQWKLANPSGIYDKCCAISAGQHQGHHEAVMFNGASGLGTPATHCGVCRDSTGKASANASCQICQQRTGINL